MTVIQPPQPIRDARGEPRVRRFEEQRWLLDNIIRANGIDWDQPRSLYLSGPCGGEANADFYLTQIVSHHQTARVAAFLDEGRRRGLAMPGVFGVFYYRSANPATLQMLRQFLPVPVDELSAEFESGATAVEVCARTIRTLLDLGARHFYVSNLPLRKPTQTLSAILDQAGVLATR